MDAAHCLLISFAVWLFIMSVAGIVTSCFIESHWQDKMKEAGFQQVPLLMAPLLTSILCAVGVVYAVIAIYTGLSKTNARFRSLTRWGYVLLWLCIVALAALLATGCPEAAAKRELNHQVEAVAAFNTEYCESWCTTKTESGECEFPACVQSETKTWCRHLIATKAHPSNSTVGSDGLAPFESFSKYAILSCPATDDGLLILLLVLSFACEPALMFLLVAKLRKETSRNLESESLSDLKTALNE